ncbi:hypothetical protein GALMADRAFT_271364 [Galerina marginata CBS 339.88]|uniref:C2H2-type domain-containing protein n=1 Tax=Galerina marginata (strain CBS 339.88) TaxID=685588 RepID=A0A067SIZ9_GALM3|nr:hypothetical protein GALMADRAFT_271364 [Galerina marginata CBS 339.88]
MDNGLFPTMDGTVAPSLYSTTTRPGTSNASNGPDRLDLSASRLHATAIYPNEPRGPVLPKEYTTKQWPPLEPYQYPLPDLGDAECDLGPTSEVFGPSFEDHPGSYIFSGISDDQTTDALPVQSHDDIEWQMYLTESLSTPLDSSFEFDHSPPVLCYPDDHLPVLAEGLPSSTSSPFPPNTPDVFNTLGFFDVALPLAPNLSLEHTAIPKLSQGNCVPSALFQAKEGTAMHDQTMAIPNGTYASLMELTPPVFNFGSAQFSSFESPSSPTKTMTVPSINSTPHRGRSFTRALHSPPRGRGLSGWDSSSFLQVPTLKSLATRTKRRRSISISPSAAVRRPYPLSPLSSTAHSEATDSSRGSKRSRLSTASTPGSTALFDFDSEDDVENRSDDGDSDDYLPSRSASPEPSYTFPLAGSHRPVSTPSYRKKSSRRGKGKAKGSAALALAVVTQLGSKSRTDTEQCDSDMEALALYQDGNTRIRKRKNHPIPLPIPVPNLNKKSRGRKVPYVADLDGVGQSGSAVSIGVKKDEERYDGESRSEVLLRPSGRPQRKTSMPEPVVDELSGSRTYVCVVNGCGKCFVRGEHLKRHVRSIHTHDKPHPCPYEGCDKSFSRRDNLGQHVRIHLLP